MRTLNKLYQAANKARSKVVVTSLSIFTLRAKYHKLKYGTELNQGEIKPPSYDSGKTSRDFQMK